jgi:hypothetical protein
VAVLGCALAGLALVATAAVPLWQPVRIHAGRYSLVVAYLRPGDPCLAFIPQGFDHFNCEPVPLPDESADYWTVRVGDYACYIDWMVDDEVTVMSRQ